MDSGRKILVIRDGTLLDGSGRPPTRNEALVVDGNRKIVNLGDRATEARPLAFELRRGTP